MASIWKIPWVRQLRRRVRRPLQVAAAPVLTNYIKLVINTVPLTFANPNENLMVGELRCEGAGAVIVNVSGEDYAVNSLAEWQFPPIQLIWNKDSFPETNIDKLIARGLTLCDRANFAEKK